MWKTTNVLDTYLKLKTLIKIWFHIVLRKLCTGLGEMLNAPVQSLYPPVTVNKQDNRHFKLTKNMGNWLGLGVSLQVNGFKACWRFVVYLPPLLITYYQHCLFTIKSIIGSANIGDDTSKFGFRSVWMPLDGSTYKWWMSSESKIWKAMNSDNQIYLISTIQVMYENKS